MVNLFELIHQKLELFRLEQRYTKRRHRRSTFVSDATYVDGEYVYTNPPSLNTTGSSSTSASSRNMSTPKIASKRHSIVDFRSVRSEDEERDAMGAGFEGHVDEKPKGGSWGRWSSGRARNKRASVAVMREMPAWEEEVR